MCSAGGSGFRRIQQVTNTHCISKHLEAKLLYPLLAAYVTVRVSWTLKPGHSSLHFKIPAGKNYPLLAAYVTVGPVSWTLKPGTHTMRSASASGEPSFIFSFVNEKNPEQFYAIVLRKGERACTMQVLCLLASTPLLRMRDLGKLTSFLSPWVHGCKHKQ